MNKIEPVIIKCTIGKYPRPMPDGMFDEMPKVKIQFETGEEKVLFEFFADEIDFTQEEFIGLTESEAYQLRFERDKQYLQS